MRHLACCVRYSVVPINFSLLTITVYSCVRTILVYKDRKNSPFNEVITEFDSINFLISFSTALSRFSPLLETQSSPLPVTLPSSVTNVFAFSNFYGKDKGAMLGNIQKHKRFLQRPCKIFCRYPSSLCHSFCRPFWMTICPTKELCVSSCTSQSTEEPRIRYQDKRHWRKMPTAIWPLNSPPSKHWLRWRLSFLKTNSYQTSS
jgi:hypothetical protein